MFKSRKGISQTQAIVVAAVVIIAVVAGYYYMSNLGPVTPSPSPSPTPTPTPTPTPPKEVVLNYPRGGIIITLDPSESYNVPTQEVVFAIYEPLFKMDPTNTSKLIPCLATSWNVSADGLSYTFHLREGVKFTDGTKFNATSVLFSFDRTITLAKTMGFGPGWNWMEVNITKSSIIDPYTVKIVLDSPYLPFIFSTASCWGDLMMSPTFCKTHATSNDTWAHDYLKANTAGTGPYMLQEYIPGDHVTLVKNPNYWGGWNGPHVDKIYMPEISDSSVQRLRLEQGSLDVGLLSISDALAVKGETGIVMSVVPTYENYFINMNTQKAPLNNVLVRQALSYMYDYNGTIQTILHGLGTQARGPIPQTLWGWNPEATQYHYNLTKAKELLAEAGYKPGDITLDYWFQSQPTPTAIAETLQAGAAKCGVTITLHGTTYATLIDAVRPGEGDATNGVDLSAQYWWPDYADPINFLQVLFACNNETQPLLLSSYPYFNWAYYCSPTVDNILKQVVIEKDFNKRVEMYHQALVQITKDSPAIFVFDGSTTLTYRSWVKGYYFNPMYQGTCDFYNIYIEGRPSS